MIPGRRGRWLAGALLAAWAGACDDAAPSEDAPDGCLARAAAGGAEAEELERLRACESVTVTIERRGRATGAEYRVGSASDPCRCARDAGEESARHDSGTGE